MGTIRQDGFCWISDISVCCKDPANLLIEYFFVFYLERLMPAADKGESEARHNKRKIKHCRRALSTRNVEFPETKEMLLAFLVHHVSITLKCQFTV